MSLVAEPPAKPRSWAGAALRLAVSAALIAWLLRRTHFGAVAATLRTADPWCVLGAMLLVPLGYIISVFRWRLLLRALGGEATFAFLLRAQMTGIFFNNLLPSTIGGDAVRAWATAQSGVRRGQAVTIIFVDRFVGLLALMLYAAGGLLVSGIGARVPALLAWVAGGSAMLALTAALLFVPALRAPELLTRLGAVLPGRFGAVPGKVASALFAFHGMGRVLAKAFAWSLLMQLPVVLNSWLLARSLHVPIPLADFFLIVPLVTFAMMLPVSINGIGVRENAYAFFFQAFGAAAAAGVAVAWLDYGIVLLQALCGGAVYALSGARRSARPVVAREVVAR